MILALFAVAVLYADLSDAELHNRVLMLSDPLAVDEIGDRAQASRYSLHAATYWSRLAQTADLCEALLDAEPSGFRRWAVEELFDSAVAGLISVVDRRPDDERWVARWRRLEAVLRRGLEHDDPAVRESFARYRRQPSLTLDEARARAQAAHGALLRLFPEERPFLERTFLMARAADKARPVDQVSERRVLMAWAHAYPRALAERLGSQALDQTGLKVEPPSRVWPDYSALLR